MDTLILTIILSSISVISGIIGTLTETKNSQTKKLTRWGIFVFVLFLTSSILSGINQIIEDDNKKIKALENAQKEFERFNILISKFDTTTIKLSSITDTLKEIKEGSRKIDDNLNSSILDQKQIINMNKSSLSNLDGISNIQRLNLDTLITLTNSQRIIAENIEKGQFPLYPIAFEINIKYDLTNSIFLDYLSRLKKTFNKTFTKIPTGDILIEVEEDFPNPDNTNEIDAYNLLNNSGFRFSICQTFINKCEDENSALILKMGSELVPQNHESEIMVKKLKNEESNKTSYNYKLIINLDENYLIQKIFYFDPQPIKEQNEIISFKDFNNKFLHISYYQWSNSIYGVKFELYDDIKIRSGNSYQKIYSLNVNDLTKKSNFVYYYKIPSNFF